MRAIITSKVFRRLQVLDKKLQEKQIPFEWTLKYSKTEGYVLVIHGDATTDFKTIALWPFYSDFNALATMIERAMMNN